jgi:hypothetical protein
VFGNRARADVHGVWLRTPFGRKTEFVSGNCERSMRVYNVDGEDSRSSGLVQDYTPRCCASGPIARRWIVLSVCRLSDCKNVSSCWKIATRDPVGRILPELVFRDRTGWTCTCVDFLECNTVPCKPFYSPYHAGQEYNSSKHNIH